MRLTHVPCRGLYLAFTLLLCACGGGTSGVTPKAQPTTASTVPPIFANGPVADDWTTFAHDQLRSGYQPQNTGITPQNVGNLQLKWHFKVPAGEHASPLVTGGNVYLFSDDGFVIAANTATGNVLWETGVAYEGRMTPAVADGMIFVGAYNGAPNFFAVNAKTGAVVWKASLPGWVRAEPVIANGIVYEGSSGGDKPFCYQGGVFAFNETTGAQTWQWLVDPIPNDGGSVWGPLSYDGQNVIFGTGNTCNTLQNLGDAVVSLTPAGTLRWEWDQTSADSRSDNDTGGAAMILHGRLYVTNKNAYLYSLNESSGTMLWKHYLGSLMGYGSVGTPTTDGNVIISSVGSYADSDTNPTPGGAIVGMSQDGALLWTIHTQHPVMGYVAITNGIAFATLDNKLVALNPETGAVLWSYTASSTFYASPVLVPSGVYAVDEAGDVYAFSLH